MIKKLVLCFALFSVCSLQAEEYFTPITKDLPPQNLQGIRGNEILENLDPMIYSSRNTYNTLVALRQNITDYLQLQQQYLQRPNDRALLFTLSQKAELVMTTIQDNQLSHAFDNEFLKDLGLFSRIAKKTQRPQP